MPAAPERTIMNDSDERLIYEALAEHLDRLPAGFPRTPEGVEIRILKMLFTPQEAELATLLTLKPESPGEFAGRTGQDAVEMSGKLEDMSRKGLIFRIRRGSRVLYMAAQFFLGIWEFHVNDLSPELIRDIYEYFPYYFGQFNAYTSQARTIPQLGVLASEQAVMPYDEARRIVSAQEKIAVAPCLCRKAHGILGGDCKKPMETCLTFADAANYYEENGLARRIDVDEAMRILGNAEENGLVLQSNNTQKPVNICSCCGCCCLILKNLKGLPEPAKYAGSNYFAVLDPKRCSGCRTCIERCQMDAVIMDGETALILKERCIGCGLCVPTCPEDAIALNAKIKEEQWVPPSRFKDIYSRIANERMAILREYGGLIKQKPGRGDGLLKQGGGRVSHSR